MLETLRDGRQVLLVGGDQCRVGLGREAVGKVENACAERVTSAFPLEQQVRGHRRAVGSDLARHGARSFTGRGIQSHLERG